jgi:spore coat polysaccharide biosynthesis protein SpsF (cytidylyltransferase family)
MRLIVNLKEDYRDAKVVEKDVYSYSIYYDLDETIKVGAYDKKGGFIKRIGEEYLLLPAFMILLANDMQENEDMAKLLLEYVDKPAVDLFVNIHEDFYQDHKFEEHTISYEDIHIDNLYNYTSLKESYKVIGENKKALKEEKTIIINKFSK